MAQIDGLLDDFPAYRQVDIRLHVGLAEMTGSPRLVAMTTEIEGAMSGLISHIAHPPEVLDAANDGHRRLVRPCGAATSRRPRARWPSTPAAPSTSWPACCRRPDRRSAVRGSAPGGGGGTSGEQRVDGPRVELGAGA